ncbi:MAG TPA: heparinase II/III family protein [Terriglobia bacterium]|nr:heparinase II/III family protein [Terriglobia bacterium]
MKTGEWGRYWRTARHLRLPQASHWMLRRVMSPARQAVAAGRYFPSGRNVQTAWVALRPSLGIPNFPEWQPELARRMIRHRRFQFLNRNFDAAKMIPWSGGGFGRLWDYHLHYFDYINLDLTSPQDEPLLHSALQMMLDWVDRNPFGKSPGWAPYPLSLRVVNWLKFLVRHSERMQELGHDAEARKMMGSLAAQAEHLKANLEKDVLTNHLLKNIKALILAGTMLETAGSDRWLDRGLKLLRREIDEQILEDGGHFQRSPMYHGQVLEDLLDLETVLAGWPQGAASARREDVGEVEAILRESILKMSDWLEEMLHPDGDIPLLNDSALGMSRLPQELLQRARAVAMRRPDIQNLTHRNHHHRAASGHAEVRVLNASGYATIRHEPSRSFLVFDCGPLGPSYQPGHGHCDLLSFELSLHGSRVVVDSGTSTYEDNPVRFKERSTAAHNTLRIDGEDQAEIWSSFRVGRRPQPGPLTGAARGQHCFVQGRYSCGASPGITHSRAVVREAGGVWWFVDLLEGSGEHRVESTLHFHPQIQVEPVRGEFAKQAMPDCIRPQAQIDFAGYRYRLLGPGAAAFSLEESWYSPEFGMRLKNKAARWTWRGRLPVMLAFALCPGECRIPEVHLSPESGCVRIDDARFLLH